MRVMRVRVVSAPLRTSPNNRKGKEKLRKRKQYNKYSNIIIRRQESSFVFFNNPPYSFTLFLRRFYNICIQNEVPSPVVC